MPDIRLKNQPFDLAFHPTSSVLYTTLLTGEVKAYGYSDETGEASSSAAWTARPSKRAARCIAVDAAGQGLWVGGKSGSLFQLNAASGSMKKERAGAHDVPINRVYCVNENLVASGDDDGVIKFWDPRQGESIRSYTQHFDYISDFCYFDDKRQLVSTSGDGHLSVLDIRSNKTTPFAVSDDQEDELLSIVPIKGDTKVAVGSGLGIVSVWSRKAGWGDCVDRVPGHPASIDAIVTLTPDVIATGSEDGMIRVMQLLPNKFLGVIASHEDYPIERIKLDRNGKWLGSVSHDECIKLTDVEDLFEESDDEDEEEDDDDEEMGESQAEDAGASDDEMEVDAEEGPKHTAEAADSDDDKPKKKRKERQKGGKGGMGDMGRNHREEDDGGFFDDL